MTPDGRLVVKDKKESDRGIVEYGPDASLARLGTDHLDLYLLHWPNGIADFSGVVMAFENLRSAGKIRAWDGT